MEFTHIIILLATGVVVGFASGLLGLGGAFIMTPIQYIVFTDMGLSPDLAIKLAFGTNLLVILPTAISGVWRHHKNQAVWWRAAIVMGGCSLVFALIGATITSYLDGEKLKIAYGTIVLLSGIRMVIDRQPRSEREAVTNPWVWAAWAAPIGLLSGIFGMGGAIVAIPVMVMALRFKMHTAVATSLGMILFTSIGGVIGYIINGLDVEGLPPYSIGYVNLSSWLLLTVTSIITAQLGAIVAHKLPARRLRFIFVIVMFYLGLKMIGVYDWLGWPL